MIDEGRAETHLAHLSPCHLVIKQLNTTRISGMTEHANGVSTESHVPQIPKSVLYYGSTTPLPETYPLRAGPLSLVFEEGDLRYVRLGNREIVRRMYVAVRDHNWDTIPGHLQDLHVDARRESFAITFTVIHHQGDIHFTWEGEIRGGSSGEITYSMNGQALSDFWRNRIGICVLHPASCAGAPCRVEYVPLEARGPETAEKDEFEESQFPQEISPHQPFFDLQSITHLVDEINGSKIHAEVRFSGDVFEMEDQRNWTDASFKTYCTPLRHPFPVEVKAGELVQQSVSIRILGDAARSAEMGAVADRSAFTQADVELTLASAPSGALPRLGLGHASHGESLSMTEISRLRALALDHLRVDLYPQSRAFVQDLRDAWQAAAFLGARLEIALFLAGNPNEELAHVARAVGEFNPDISHWLVFSQQDISTPARVMELARDILTPITPQTPFIAGTNAYFTELNRERPPVAVADGVCYSINPQVHAFDLQSLVETLEVQATTVATTRTFAKRGEARGAGAGDLPIYISPVTLRPRFNPNATGPEPDPAPGHPPSQVDPRQMSLFGAGWTLGSVKYLAAPGGHPGVAGITYYETTGPQGVMEREQGSPWHDTFRSLPGAVFPLYHVLADIGEYSGGQIVPVATSNNLHVEGLALHARDGRRRILVANLTAAPRTVRVNGIRGARVIIRYLDERNVLFAMQQPEQFRAQSGDSQPVEDGALTVDLLPFAVLRLDQLHDK
jgi:D-apionolactonase